MPTQFWNNYHHVYTSQDYLVSAKEELCVCVCMNKLPLVTSSDPVRQRAGPLSQNKP